MYNTRVVIWAGEGTCRIHVHVSASDRGDRSRYRQTEKRRRQRMGGGGQKISNQASPFASDCESPRTPRHLSPRGLHHLAAAPFPSRGLCRQVCMAQCRSWFRACECEREGAGKKACSLARAKACRSQDQLNYATNRVSRFASSTHDLSMHLLQFLHLDSSLPKCRAARSADGSTAAECKDKDKGETSAAEKRAGR